MTEARIRRLQMWLLVLAFVVVFLGVLAPTAVIAFLNIESDQTQRDIACQALNTQRKILRGINQLRHELGIPDNIPLPEVAPECVG